MVRYVKKGTSTTTVKELREKYSAKINPENRDILLKYKEHIIKVRGCKKDSANERIRVLQRFLYWITGYKDNRPIPTLSADDITDYFAFCEEKLDYDSSTLKTAGRIIKNFLHFIEEVLSFQYPSYRTPSYKYTHKKDLEVIVRKQFTDEEIKRVLDILVEQEQYEFAFFLAMCCYSNMDVRRLFELKLNFMDRHNLQVDNYFISDETVATNLTKTQIYGQFKNFAIAKYVYPYFELWLKYREEKEYDTDRLFFRIDMNGKIRKRYNAEFIFEKFTDLFGERISKAILADHYLHTMVKDGIQKTFVINHRKYHTVTYVENLYENYYPTDRK